MLELSIHKFLVLEKEKVQKSYIHINPQGSLSYCLLPQKKLFRSHMQVMIAGDFPCNLHESKLWAWFGDMQVPAEIIQEGVLRCWAPSTGAGKVNFHITNQAGEQCSEMREFEFCENPCITSTSDPEELDLLIKFVKTLLGESSEYLGHLNLRSLMEKLLKDKLEDLVLKERVMNGEGRYVLPKDYHGVIHLISGLGFHWGLKLLLDSGVSINYRDKNGWTALHWAARFGRYILIMYIFLFLKLLISCLGFCLVRNCHALNQYYTSQVSC